MEIGPIAAIRAVPMIKPLRSDADLSAVFGVEFRGRAGDETYSSNRQKAARGLENDNPNDEDLGDEDSGMEEENMGLGKPAAGGSGKISFFA